jgi:four helix bundle protein
MNNISEGFLRHRDREFMQFLRVSAGSNGEVRSGFYAAHGRNYIEQTEADDLIAENNGIGKMIRRLQSTLDVS